MSKEEIIDEVVEIEKEETLPPPPPRRHKSFFSFKKLCITFAIALGLLGISWISVFIYFDYTNQLPIKTVKVLGVYQYVKEEDIANTLTPFISGKGLFAFSEWQAEKALEQLPGVADATIWRVPPYKIKVIIRERSAMARFGNGSLLSSDGVIFQTTNPAGADNLPILNGDPIYVKDMLKMLSSLKPIFATINANVTGLGIAENGDWSVQLNQQTWIMLGKTDLQNRVLNFLTAYPVLMSTALPGATLNYVDLRYTRGFTASWIGGTPPTKSSS